jgi:hypothetical protein
MSRHVAIAARERMVRSEHAQVSTVVVAGSAATQTGASPAA